MVAEPASVFVTGANAAYGYHLLNLLGSLRRNSPIFGRVVAYDLGLTEHQRRLLDAVEGVETFAVEPFAPHWQRGFTWKPWIWTHVEADGAVLWLDAGTTILRGLVPVLEQIHSRGYFVVAQGHPLHEIVPRDYWALYDVPAEARGRDYVAGGVIGFDRRAAFYERVIVPTFADCLAGRSLGTSRSQLEPDEPVRDCPNFRHDQTVLNLNLFSVVRDPAVNDLDEFAGWRSPRDHPRQLIWNHRRRGDLAYLARVPYRRDELRNRAFGLAFRLRWWLKLNERWFSRTTYVLKWKKLTRAAARR